MKAAERMLELWGEVADLATAEAVLSWDQETQMPPRGHEGRAQVLASLAGLKHARLVDPALREALEAAAEEAPPGSELEAQVREARRAVARASRVPGDLARALAEAASRGLVAWQAARREKDFGLFRDALAHNIDLKRQAAAAIDPEGEAYDVLIDEYEPGGRADEIAPIFEGLQAELTPLVRAVRESGRTIDESPLRGSFAPDAQLAFARRIAEQMGFDFEAGRIDRSAHPFCTGFGPGDVRLTWRHLDDDVRSALFGIMHEAGHGLYEQGLPRAWVRTPIGPAQSMSIHESQSRLWENLVGRSKGFWRWALPSYHEHFPDKRDVTVEALWPALHTVKPSLIRVEADEGTYNLHIIARFELEKRLFAGGLEVDDLPDAWDEAYEALLGIRPPDPAQGVLQDIHWSMGGFGYFPTYALGNLIAAQLFEAAERDLGSLEPAFESGDFAPLLGWLRENVHAHGSRYGAAELVQRATGAPLSAEAFLRHLKRVTAEVYGL